MRTLKFLGTQTEESRQKKRQKMTQERGCAAKKVMPLTQIVLCTFFVLFFYVLLL